MKRFTPSLIKVMAPGFPTQYFFSLHPATPVLRGCSRTLFDFIALFSDLSILRELCSPSLWFFFFFFPPRPLFFSTVSLMASFLLLRLPVSTLLKSRPFAESVNSCRLFFLLCFLRLSSRLRQVPLSPAAALPTASCAHNSPPSLVICQCSSLLITLNIGYYPLCYSLLQRKRR